MTEAVRQTVYVTDANGYRQPTPLWDVIQSSLTTKAAKGDLRAAALVLRELERERANGMIDSSAGGSLPSGGETPRRSFREIFGDFFQAIWEETYQMSCHVKREHPTSPEEHYLRNATQIYMNYLDGDNDDDGKYYNYQIFLWMLMPIEIFQLMYKPLTRDLFEQIVNDYLRAVEDS